LASEALAIVLADPEKKLTEVVLPEFGSGFTLGKTCEILSDTAPIRASIAISPNRFQ
jgi:hypothetical protein